MPHIFPLRKARHDRVNSTGKPAYEINKGVCAGTMRLVIPLHAVKGQRCWLMDTAERDAALADVVCRSMRTLSLR